MAYKRRNFKKKAGARGRGGIRRGSRKQRSGATSLTVRKLSGLPDRIHVKLPYVFNYLASFNNPGTTTAGGDILFTCALNSYPNVAGFDLAQDGGSTVNRLEVPTNFFQYAGQYSKLAISGAKYDVNVSLGPKNIGAAGITGNVDTQTFMPTTLCSIISPYDGSEGGNIAAGSDFDSAGGFRWNGVTGGFGRGTASQITTTGNWSTIQALSVEELMSAPNTRFKHLSSVFGSKTMAKFKGYANVKKYTAVKDIMDAEDLSFSVPQTATTSIAGTGYDANPRRGMGLQIMAFSPSNSTASAAQSYIVSGRITYYCTFYQRRPIIQFDWLPAS